MLKMTVRRKKVLECCLNRQLGKSGKNHRLSKPMLARAGPSIFECRCRGQKTRPQKKYSGGQNFFGEEESWMPNSGNLDF